MYSNEFILSFCERLAGQMPLYAPADVVRAMTNGSLSARAWGPNATVFGLTVASPRGLGRETERVWYHSGARVYVRKLRDVRAERRSVWLAHYIYAGVLKLRSVAVRACFLDLCECAIRSTAALPDGLPDGLPDELPDECARSTTLPAGLPAGLPDELPMGVSVRSIQHLRKYLIERSLTR